MELCGYLFIASLMISSKLANGDIPEPCSQLKMVERDEWRARPQGRDSGMTIPVNEIIIIHTVTQMCSNTVWCKRSVRAMQDDHLDNRGWYDIAYNFLIGGDGLIYVGRGWDQSGMHSVNYNLKSIGVAFIGNFSKDVPTDDMLRAALNLIDCGVEQGYLTPTREIHGHRDVTCVLSPGQNLYEIIKKWRNFKGGRIKDYSCYNE